MPREAMHSNPSNIDLSLSDLDPSSSVIEWVGVSGHGRHPPSRGGKDHARI